MLPTQDPRFLGKREPSSPKAHRFVEQLNPPREQIPSKPKSIYHPGVMIWKPLRNTGIRHGTKRPGGWRFASAEPLQLAHPPDTARVPQVSRRPNGTENAGRDARMRRRGGHESRKLRRCWVIFGRLVDLKYCGHPALLKVDGKSSRVRRTQVDMEAGRGVFNNRQKGELGTECCNVAMVLRSLRSQHRSHSTGSMSDFHPL